MTKNEITEKIIGFGITVHKILGPGLLESAYEECLCHELYLNNIRFERQKPLPLIYKDVKLDCGYRIDLQVENQIIVEIKTVDKINDVHLAQILTYLRLSKCSLGMIMNFNVNQLIKGIKRFIL